MAGRGAGKTRTAAEWIHERVRNGYAKRILLLGRTSADVRDVMITGESGLLNTGRPDERPDYFPSKRLLVWPNGAEATAFCADPETKALTPDGWVTHDQLVSGDLIRVLDVDARTSRWSPIKNMHRFDVVDEPMVSVEQNYHSSLVTLAHRWPVMHKSTRKLRWRESLLDFNTKDSFITGAPGDDLPTDPKYSDALVALVGWYTAEGHINTFEELPVKFVCHDRNGLRQLVRERLKYLGWKYQDIGEHLGVEASTVHGMLQGGLGKAEDRAKFAYAIGLAASSFDAFFEPFERRTCGTISQNIDGEHESTIRAWLMGLFGPAVASFKDIRHPAWRDTEAGGRMTTFLLNHEALEVLSAHAVGKEKVVTNEFICALTRNQLELFLRSVIDGDGSWKSGGKVAVIAQKTATRLDSVELAAILLGWSVRRERKFSYLLVSQVPKLVIPGTRPPDSRVIFEAANLTFNKATVPVHPVHPYDDHRWLTEYTGVVWCPETEEGTWLAQRNGTVYYTGNSADEPDQTRGPQGDTAWGDEFATWPNISDSDGATAFDNLRLGLRLPVLGDMPRMILTTTPRRTPSMFKILEEAENPDFGIVITRGTTYENLANLADNFRATILGLYEGTRLGRQELLGEMLTDVEGALFRQEWFDDNRVEELPYQRMFAVVGVDPSVAERPRDECGIVVMKATMERDFYRRHLYVVEDASVLGPPAVWAARVAEMARKWNAPIVAEGNQGGELVRMAIAQADSNLPVHIVHAKVGKATRAEPVAALFEQKRGHLLGVFPKLEDEMVSWIPGDRKNSPDRLDACVISGSLVATDRGQVPVELLRVGRLVRTRVGFHRVLGTELMGRDRLVVRVVTDRGSFTATPDHRVWTVGGRVPSSEARVGDVVVVDRDGRPDRVVWVAPLVDGSLEVTTLRGKFVVPAGGTVEVATGSWWPVDDLVPGMRGVWCPPDGGWFARWRGPGPLAEFTVLRIEDAGTADVWDVMVEDEHEFFTDGHLVHNCVWAALSLSTRQKGVSFALGRHLRARSSRGKLPPMNAAAFDKRSKKTGWQAARR